MGELFRGKKINISKDYNGFLIVIGALLILYCLFGLSLGWGFYFGLKVISVSGIFLLIHGFLGSYYDSYRRSMTSKLINLGITIALISFIVLEGFILTGAYINDIDDIDYILILGAGIIEDRPSLELRHRLDTAMDFMEESSGEQKVVLCGGKGNDEKFSEAYVMEKYLIDNGINENMILKEEKSRSTYENIKYAREVIRIIDSRDKIKVAISSNDFHLFRAKLIARRQGLEATGLPSKTPLYIIPNHHVREYFAIINTIFFK